MEEEDQIEPENLMSYSVEKLEQLFQDNKYSIQIIASLMKKYLNDKEQQKIDNLFVYANTYFILPEECWIECIDNRIGYSQSKEQYEEILKLFDKGLQDGFYFELAKKYAKFCLQLFKLGILSASQIKINFQKLIGKFNNDFNKGSKFYRKLRKFYTSSLQQSQDPKSLKEINNQIRQLFRRQLEHPLADIDITWESYQQWEEPDNNLNIEEMKKVYNQSYELVEKYLDLEEQFEVSLGGNQLGLLIEFFNGMDVLEIGFRKIQNYYERVLDEFPYEVEIWRLYVEFIKTNLKIIPEQLQYYERAAKNCQQEIDFLKLFIRSIEKNNLEIEKIEEQVMHFIQGMEDKQNQFILWQLLCEVHYRKVVNSVIEAQGKNKNNYFVGEIVGMEKVTVIKIRDLFQRAIDFFQTYNKNEQEENQIYISNLLLYWANFETYFAKDKPAMDKTMNSYMKLNSAKCDAWIQYLNFELAFGNINSARSVIKRGVNIVKDDIQEICLEYVEFERRFGGIEEIEQAEEVMLDKVSKMLNQEQQQQQEVVVQQQEKIQEEVKEKKKKKGKKKEVKKTKKEEAMEREIEEEEESKRIESRRQIYYDFENTIFVKNVPKHFTEQELIEIFPNKNQINECRLVKDKETNLFRGIAYIDFVNGQQAQIACRDMNNKKIEGQNLKVFISKPPSHDAELDERTLFLNDLPYSITEEILRKEFSAVGKYIEEIRIIINKATGKPKGFAYMQLSTKAATQEALEKYSKLTINNRKIIVLLANSQKVVNNTVMLKNLAFSVNEADIIDFFREKGLEVVNVLVVRTNEGKSKGTGFAEFKDYKSFMRALDFKKGELLGRVFEIIKSKSPITQKKEPEKPHVSGLSNEQSAKFILNYGEQEQEKKQNRPKDNFRRKEQQRNVLSINQKTREEEGTQGQDNEQIQENQQKKRVKTNDDFRSLLLGNK